MFTKSSFEFVTHIRNTGSPLGLLLTFICLATTLRWLNDPLTILILSKPLLFLRLNYFLKSALGLVTMHPIAESVSAVFPAFFGAEVEVPKEEVPTKALLPELLP